MGDEGKVKWVTKTAFVMPLLPPEIRIDPVLAGLLHCMAFLELSGDETVDPDWAVEAMEHVAAYMLRLSPQERDAVGRQLGAVSDYYRQVNGPAKLVAFVDGFLGSCGIPKAGTPS